ncbi:MAG TPA: glucose 1-dehydrogenase [Acidimicrobiales bacterium]|jgi:3alpha(or 20beta)-hydroxysteroid dehydrogenase
MPEPVAGRLAGKVALISGASRGQGEAEARLFVSEGAEVILGDVLDKQGEAVAEDLGDAAIYRHHDVTSESDWADIVAAGRQEFGHIDVLVNNAGVFRVMSMLDTSLEEYRRVTEINQTGVFLGMKAVAPVMIEQGRGGSIINISSVAGLRGAATTFAYGASKWAVRGMTKGAARELAPHQIRVNSVHPGLISTTMLEEFDRLGTREHLKTLVPLGQESGPEEVAKLVLFLASEDSRHSTGAEFVVDGGMMA